MEDDDIFALNESILSLRERYEEMDREGRISVICELWRLPWKPTVGFVADVVNRPRATIAEVTRGVIR